MKKMKLRYRAVLPLILFGVLLSVPAALSLDGGNVLLVRAQDREPGDGGIGETIENGTEGKAGEEAGNAWCGSVSGGDAGSVCICGKKCSAYDYDSACGVCTADYRDCGYKAPNVVIGITRPDGWHSGGSAKVKFTVADAAHTGNFEPASIRAKIGQNGGWMDVTEDRELEISENCTVYVQVTDQKGNTYEKNRFVKCFDTTRPTLNAAVSDGLLTIQVSDMDSGAKSVYVNGYEFKELTEGVLNIRLQQFDAGYEYFTIYAMDNAGNLSEAYKTKNPYYKSPEDDSNDNPAGQLPVSAGATKPGSAAAVVTEHTKTDGNGNAVSQIPEEEGNVDEGGEPERGREFYTIQTASDKVFYLIVDRDGDEEMVYFLTEVTENDLLNVTSGNSEVLPKNSAAAESAIPIEESALPDNHHTDLAGNTEQTGGSGEDTGNTEQAEGSGKDTENIKDTGNTEPGTAAEDGATPLSGYIFMGLLAAAVIGGAYYFKVVRRKKEDFIEDEDEDGEESEEYEDEEEPEGDPDDDFFDGDGEE